jgi:tetratricopeptide (TPR) repeat protein
MSHHRHPLAKQRNRTAAQGPSRRIEVMLVDALRHHRAGRLTDAERIYRQILALDSHHADSLHLLGMIAHQRGQHEFAAEMILKAIGISGKAACYHSNLGNILQAQNKLDEAAACYERALALDPDCAEAHTNLGNILHGRGKLDEAEAHHRRSLAANPELAESHYNLGNTLQSQDRVDDAAACYERALALRPDYAKAHYNLGTARLAQANPDEALAEYRKALAIQPGYAQAAFAESLTQLLKGDFTAGWQNFEWRWQAKNLHETPMRAYPQPLWKGEKFASGRLLIWGEQGIGDEIMFAGLIPDVILTGNRCILDCNARLKPLFARSFAGVDVVTVQDEQQNPSADIVAHLPSGSLPGIFRRTPAAFADTTSPYLVASAAARERFRVRYADGRRLAGLAWHTTNQKTGRSRSIDLSLFAPLFARREIRWISLQYGDHRALENQAKAAGAPILIDRSVDQLANIDIFAAQIAAMDLVVTIDNSTAHLAGALGVPALVLLPAAPDWRWLEEREDCPWYPTLRLFRQPKLGDWHSAIQRVQSVL